MDSTPETSEASEPQVGRNEPCPCGSGKKYKRCCGVGAAPKLSAPAMTMPQFPAGAPGAPGAGGLPPGMDPAMMAQVGQLLQRLPKSQLQRLQGLMQRAMAGKDVSREAAEFEKTLPLEFQSMMRSMAGNLGAGIPGADAAADLATSVTSGAGSAPGEMTEEEARRIVEAAAQQGQLSEEKAAELLSPKAEPSGLGKLFGKFGKR